MHTWPPVLWCSRTVGTAEQARDYVQFELCWLGFVEQFMYSKIYAREGLMENGMAVRCGMQMRDADAVQGNVNSQAMRFCKIHILMEHLPVCVTCADK